MSRRYDPKKHRKNWLSHFETEEEKHAENYRRFGIIPPPEYRDKVREILEQKDIVAHMDFVAGVSNKRRKRRIDELENLIQQANKKKFHPDENLWVKEKALKEINEIKKIDKIEGMKFKEEVHINELGEFEKYLHVALPIPQTGDFQPAPVYIEDVMAKLVKESMEKETKTK